MQVGIFCSSNRPHLWGNLIKTLSKNDIDWNLCIAGPHPPLEPLPGNVKYIQTNVKPAQCWFIASQNVVGDYIINVPDDASLNPGGLDDLVKLSDKMTISSPAFLMGSEKVNQYQFPNAKGYPLDDPRSSSSDKNVRRRWITMSHPYPVCSMVYRETFDSIGIDKNYVALYWDYDMAFELISRGGRVILSEFSTIVDFKASKTCLSRIGCDHYYLSDMWIDGDVVRDKRKSPVVPFVCTEDVSNRSQGTKSAESLIALLILSGKTEKEAKKISKMISRWE